MCECDAGMWVNEMRENVGDGDDGRMQDCEFTGFVLVTGVTEGERDYMESNG